MGTLPVLFDSKFSITSTRHTLSLADIVMIVSPDAAISIAFGLLSTIISLLSLLVGYLTLRSMPSHNCKLGSYATSSASPFIVDLTSYYIDAYPPSPPFLYTLHHEHTHFVTQAGRHEELDITDEKWRH